MVPIKEYESKDNPKATLFDYLYYTKLRKSHWNLIKFRKKKKIYLLYELDVCGFHSTIIQIEKLINVTAKSSKTVGYRQLTLPGVEKRTITTENIIKTVTVGSR